MITMRADPINLPVVSWGGGGGGGGGNTSTPFDILI